MLSGTIAMPRKKLTEWMAQFALGNDVRVRVEEIEEHTSWSKADIARGALWMFAMSDVSAQMLAVSMSKRGEQFADIDDPAQIAQAMVVFRATSR